MEFRQLRYFIEISRRRSFVRAAGALGLTQPALSRQIALLEKETGRELFEREARGVRLTTAGEKLLSRAVRLNDLWRETLESLGEEEDALSGEYAVAAGGTVAAYILPGALSRTRGRHPELRLRVLEGDASRAREAVKSGTADLGILTGPIKDKELSSRYFLSDRIVPAVRRDHPLLRKRRIAPRDLVEQEFVLFHPASAIRQTADKKLRTFAPGFKPRVTLELRGVDSTLRSLEAGLGIGFISEFALTARLKILNIPELIAERRFYFCWRRTRPGLERLIEEIAAGAKTA